MKKPSQRLQTVLTLAKLREKLAAENLANKIRAAMAQKQQIEQLRSFQEEYNSQFRTLSENGATPQQLKNFQNFYGNLEQAVDSSEQQHVNSEDQQEIARKNWIFHYSKQKNMESLIERKHQLEEKEVEKMQQREYDDRKPYKPIG
ncbi:MAG: flagellar FliJ protein [Oceanicoccus sp.]